MIEEEIVMIKSWKKAAIMCLTSLLLATALPFGAQVKAASSSPLHSKLDADGKEDKIKLTYTVKLDKTELTDGRVAVVYDKDVLDLTSNATNLKFTEVDFNKDYKNDDEKGLSFAFVNDSSKKFKGTLLTLKFQVKEGTPKQETVIKTTVLGLNNEDEEIEVKEALEDKVTVGRDGLKAAKLNSAKATSNGVKLKWTKDKSADGYVVYRSSSKDGNFEELAQVSGSSYEDGTVKRGRTYYYQLKAYQNYKGKKVYSEASKILSVKIK
jgi:hypothetical protein